MTRKQQYEINCEAVYRWKQAIDEIEDENKGYFNVKNLRSCSARVYETENFYILQSYFTFVAAIDKRDKVAVDMLRNVYGYTSTSAQHIAKFIHDYTPYPWNSPKYVWRHLNKQ